MEFKGYSFKYGIITSVKYFIYWTENIPVGYHLCVLTDTDPTLTKKNSFILFNTSRSLCNSIADTGNIHKPINLESSFILTKSGFCIWKFCNYLKKNSLYSDLVKLFVLSMIGAPYVNPVPK